MGDSEIIKKFRRILEECEEEHVFNGTILELDTPIDYAPYRVRGISVEAASGLHKVRFSRNFRNDLDIEIAPLNIEDEVVVFGRQSKQKENETSPIIILLPKERTMILAREREPTGWQGGWSEWSVVGSAVVALVLSAVGMYIVYFEESSSYTPLEWFVGAYFFFFLMLGLEWYNKFSKRERVIHCNPKDWEIITEEVSRKYNIM
ncbi:MAG: hypothetical protein ACFFF9_02240 [Candidatus Thorarchaeota archaeon]